MYFLNDPDINNHKLATFARKGQPMSDEEYRKRNGGRSREQVAADRKARREARKKSKTVVKGNVAQPVQNTGVNPATAQQTNNLPNQTPDKPPKRKIEDFTDYIKQLGRNVKSGASTQYMKFKKMPVGGKLKTLGIASAGAVALGVGFNIVRGRYKNDRDYEETRKTAYARNSRYATKLDRDVNRVKSGTESARNIGSFLRGASQVSAEVRKWSS